MYPAVAAPHLLLLLALPASGDEGADLCAARRPTASADRLRLQIHAETCHYLLGECGLAIVRGAEINRVYSLSLGEDAVVM